MKKVLFVFGLVLLSVVAFSQPISYTPFTAAGYSFKDVRTDSGFAVPLRDTSVGRGTTRPGSIVCRPQDSLFYGWNGARWSLVNSDLSSVIALIDEKVDSVTVDGDSIFYWKLGISYGYVFNTASWLLTGNNITSGQFLGSLTAEPLLMKVNDSTMVFVSDTLVTLGDIYSSNTGTKIDISTKDSTINLLSDNLNIVGLASSSDTATYKPIGLSSAGVTRRMSLWPGGGSGVNIYNSDGTITGNRTVDADGNNLTFNNVNGFEVSSNSLQISGEDAQIDAGTGGLSLSSTDILSLQSDSIVLFNYPDSLTSNYSTLVRDRITGKIGVITASSGSTYTATLPISISGGNVISMTRASATDSGYVTTGTQTIAGNKTFSGLISLGNGSTATTQSANDNSTKIATTAYVDAVSEDYSLNVYADLGATTPYGQTAFCNIGTNSAAGNIANNAAVYQAVYIPKAVTITGVRWNQITNGVYLKNANENRIGLFSYSAGTLTRIAATNDDSTLWKSGTGVISKAFASTVAVTPGTYYIGWVHNGSVTTIPTIAQTNGSNQVSNWTGIFTNSAKIYGYRGTQNTLPSSESMSNLSAFNQLYYFLLY